MALADEGIAAAIRTGAGFMLAEHHRIRGELLACRPGNTPEVERELRTARSIAREQQAHLYELRAAIGLARLRWDEGRHDSARGLLEESYEAFREGHDQVADLQRARGLVELWRRG